MNSQIFEIKQENQKVAMALGSAFCRSVHQSLTQVIRKCTNAEGSTAKSIGGLKNKLRDLFLMPVIGKKFLVKIHSPEGVTYPYFINSTTVIQDAGVLAGSPNMTWIYWDMDSSSSQSHLLTRYVDDCINQSPQGLPVAVIVKAHSSESLTTKDQLLILERHVNGSIPIVFFDENQIKFINLKPDAIAWEKNRIEKLIFATLSYATLEKLLAEIDSQVAYEATLLIEIKAIRKLFSKEFND
jgi:hypothetical protein